MKTLYLECNMGAAGDMLMAALFELLDEKEQADFLLKMNEILPEGVHVGAVPDEKCGLTGTHVHVHVHGEEEGCSHHHETDCYGHTHEQHEHGHTHAHPHHHLDEGNGHEHHHDYAHGHEHDHENHDHHEEHDCENHDYHDEHGHHHHHHEHSHAHHHHDEHDYGHTHHHHHSGLSEIYSLIDGMTVSDKVKTDAKDVYRLIAEAESKVHGKTMEQIHFHEVGTLDAVADVVGNCLLMEKIGADRIIASPVHVGCGSVKCAHGMLPVPAPATALILEGIPVYGGEVRGELCTPTGAALLKYFAGSFETMPPMIIKKIGYGMGTKDFPERPNCIRVLFGEDSGEASGRTGGGADTAVTAAAATNTRAQGTATPAAPPAPDMTETAAEVTELAANIDDMTGEELAFAMEILLAAGALDVYFTPITMKKSRPAVKLSCLCRAGEEEGFAALMLKHTSTIGVRAYACSRFTLQRSSEKRETPWGEVEVKVCSGFGVTKEKPEFDRLREIAEEHNLSLAEIKAEIKKELK